MNLKRKPIRDPQHLKFVRTLPCIKCDSSPCDAHHIRAMTDGGIGIKPSDSFTVPLCRTHHAELHNTGERTYFKQQMANVRALSIDLYCASGKRERCIEDIEKWRKL